MKALKKHSVNFYDRYTVDPEKEHRKKIIMLYSLPVIALVAYLGVTVFSLYTEKTSLEAEIAEQQLIMGDIDLMEDYTSALKNAEELGIFEAEVDGIELFREIKATYPEIGKNEIYRIFDSTPLDVAIIALKYSCQDGMIYITAEASDVSVIPLYLDELKKTGMLVNADYGGYSGSAEGSGNGNDDEQHSAKERYVYTVSINLQMNAPENTLDLSKYFGSPEDSEEDGGESSGSDDIMDMMD